MNSQRTTLIYIQLSIFLKSSYINTLRVNVNVFFPSVIALLVPSLKLLDISGCYFIKELQLQLKMLVETSGVDVFFRINCTEDNPLSLKPLKISRPFFNRSQKQQSVVFSCRHT